MDNDNPSGSLGQAKLWPAQTGMENDKDAHVVVQNGLRTWQSGVSVTSKDGVRQHRDIEGQHHSRLMGETWV